MYEVVGFNHSVRLVLRVVMLGYSKTYKCRLVSGPKREISEASKLVDQRTLCTVSSTIPSGLVASCRPVLPSADIGEHNLAGTAGVCVDSCYNPFRGIVCDGARTLRTCIGVA